MILFLQWLTFLGHSVDTQLCLPTALYDRLSPVVTCLLPITSYIIIVAYSPVVPPLRDLFWLRSSTEL